VNGERFVTTAEKRMEIRDTGQHLGGLPEKLRTQSFGVYEEDNAMNSTASSVADIVRS
jgi:hypothetical protein